MNPAEISIVFMGTADFAVPSLTALSSAGFKIVLVVTRPDKPKGRGLEMSETPVKKAALELGLDVFQPAGIRDPATWSRLKDCNADFFVVAAYGRILPPEVLAMPRFGCVNVHGSLLPRYRGAAPIQRAVINGESETGVTIMLMDEGCDTGPELIKGSTPILPDDTAATLFDRLSQMGPPLLLSAIHGLYEGTMAPVAQNHALATAAPIISKETGEIDWASSSATILNLVRGVDPWPGAFTFTPAGVRVRIFPFLEAFPAAGLDGSQLAELPGTILKIGISGEGMLVKTGDGAVVVGSVQPAGSRKMTPAAMAAGRKIQVGDRLGPCPLSAGEVEST